MIPRWLLPPAALGLAMLTGCAAATFDPSITSYIYGDPIPVECMNRSSETGEHIQDSTDAIQWIPFPSCAETLLPLALSYGHETELNCTIPMIDDPFFHLLEFYIHNDVPMTCRVPAFPPPQIQDVAPGADADKKVKVQEYVPLIFALAGTLQLSHMHVSTRLNVLVHSSYQDLEDGDKGEKDVKVKAKRKASTTDAGILDSAIAYSTSPLVHNADAVRLVIGDPLPLKFSVRWFPTPRLPHTDGKVEWQGMGGHVYASTIFYGLLAFGAGVTVSAVWFFGHVLPQRLRGRSLGGATPLGYGVAGPGGMGNGWGIPKGNKRID